MRPGLSLFYIFVHGKQILIRFGVYLFRCFVFNKIALGVHYNAFNVLSVQFLYLLTAERFPLRRPDIDRGQNILLFIQFFIFDLPRFEQCGGTGQQHAANNGYGCGKAKGISVTMHVLTSFSDVPLLHNNQ